MREGWNVRQLDLGIGGDGLCHAICHQRQGRRIVSILEKRNGFASETADFAVRQDGLEPISDLRAVLAIIDGRKDQHAAIRLLTADAPLLEKFYRVIVDVVAIERLHSYDCDLRLRFLINFSAYRFELGFRVGSERVRKVVDVSRWFQRLNRLRDAHNCAENDQS